MGLKEFREKSIFSAVCLAEKWELGPNIQHTSYEEATEFRRDPTVPFDPGSLGFTQLGHLFLSGDSTRHLELWDNSVLQYTEHLCPFSVPQSPSPGKGW